VDIVLIGGLWLDGTAWDQVVPEIERLGHRAAVVRLPAEPGATLDDQVAAVLAAVDGTAGKPLVVGHSAAATLAWIAADARPERVGKVAFIGGFPNEDGTAYADFFPTVDGAMPFPGWAPFDGPDSADLDEAARARIAERAIPVPAGVSTATVHLIDDRRYGVPVLLVCPEFTPAQAKEWLAAGQLPEIARAKHVEFADIDSGHWPMFTKPAELARILAAAAG
jgi:pimeloyl-ACP methyl ester carboxylesterase